MEINHFKEKYMKTYNRIILTTLVVFIVCSIFGQPASVKPIKHTYFTSYFSAKAHIPIVLTYAVTSQMVSCPDPLGRGKFAADPLAPEETDLNADYESSGFDRGHNMSAADNGCDETGMEECFYYSNMAPQTHHFNAGVWKSLEMQERKYAADEGRIFVFVGSIGKQKSIGTHNVVVPKYMWKLIYHPTTHRYESYYFPNTNDTEQPYDQYRITFESLQKKTGIEFNGSRFKWVTM